MAVPFDTLTDAERYLAELAGDLPSPDRTARISANQIAAFFAGAARARAEASADSDTRGGER